MANSWISDPLLPSANKSFSDSKFWKNWIKLYKYSFIQFILKLFIVYKGSKTPGLMELNYYYIVTYENNSTDAPSLRFGS